MVGEEFVEKQSKKNSRCLEREESWGQPVEGRGGGDQEAVEVRNPGQCQGLLFQDVLWLRKGGGQKPPGGTPAAGSFSFALF